MTVQKIRARQSAAPAVWFFLLWPYRVLVYMIWAALISARAVLFILIVASTLVVPFYVLMSVSYFGMNIAAGQVEILESVDVLAGFFGSAYNDFIAEPYNNIADCYAGIVACDLPHDIGVMMSQKDVHMGCHLMVCHLFWHGYMYRSVLCPAQDTFCAKLFFFG